MRLIFAEIEETMMQSPWDPGGSKASRVWGPRTNSLATMGPYKNGFPLKIAHGNRPQGQYLLIYLLLAEVLEVVVVEVH